MWREVNKREGEIGRRMRGRWGNEKVKTREGDRKITERERERDRRKQ